MTNQDNVKIDNNAFAVDMTEAEMAAENAQEAVQNALYKLKFKKPFEFEGKKYEELSFDFDALTGKDFLKMEQEMNLLGMAVISPEYSTPFIARMAVKSCNEKITIDFVESLPLKEFNALRSMARNFLTK